MIIDDKIEFSLITKKRGFMEYHTHETNIKRENRERDREREMEIQWPRVWEVLKTYPIWI